MPESKALKAYRQRVTEDYILTQVDYHADQESFRDWHDRMADGDKLYDGQLDGLFPDDTKIPNQPYVENKYKNALHDLARLATEGRGAVKFLARGDRESHRIESKVRESINEGYWALNNMPSRERQLYLDLFGSGIMAAALYYDDRLHVPQATLLNPRYCYPDVRNGVLLSMLTVESAPERLLARQLPHLGLNADATNQTQALLVCLYDDEGVTEAVALGDNAGKYDRAAINKQWLHELGCVPVAFEMLDTWDRSFHGLLEQLAGPLMVRNKIAKFMVDDIEQRVYAPFEERGIENADTPPGPETIYRHDRTVEGATFMRRVQPATSSQDIWRTLAYMGDQEEKEGIQPPARSGNVSQSIASGSFVDRTQGQLTSVTKEGQDKMSSFRKQFDYIAMKIDERWMDESKPLYRPVGNKSTYTPSKDIAQWYVHEVRFGAGAGLDRINTDQRVFNAYSAGVISPETVRANLDYLDNESDEPDRIVSARLEEALLQRFASNPNTPTSALLRAIILTRKDGKSFVDALSEIEESVQQAERAALGQAPAAPAGVEGEPGAEGIPAGTEQLRIQGPLPPMQQVILRGGVG